MPFKRSALSRQKTQARRRPCGALSQHSAAPNRSCCSARTRADHNKGLPEINSLLFCILMASHNPQALPMDVALPMDKICIPSKEGNGNQFVVLVSAGSFNPPTYMHLRMFELAKDALTSRGFYVIGAYMSPANDAYGKKGLISAEHRIQLCELACRSSPFIMVDSWEAQQNSYQRTLTVLYRIRSSLCESGSISKESVKIMLLCGSDLLESFSIPGAWIRDQVRVICRDFGVVCIRREGKEIERIVMADNMLHEHKDNIIVVDELVPNLVSSTRVRECLSRGLSIKYLTADEVIDYIHQHQLYANNDSRAD